MKYKIGDKVRIKTWEEMVQEFGLNKSNDINNLSWCYLSIMDKQLEGLNCDRILTIEQIIFDNKYTMEKIGYTWTNDMIKELEKEYIKSQVITDRFDILDIR